MPQMDFCAVFLGPDLDIGLDKRRTTIYPPALDDDAASDDVDTLAIMV